MKLVALILLCLLLRECLVDFAAHREEPVARELIELPLQRDLPVLRVHFEHARHIDDLLAEIVNR